MSTVLVARAPRALAAVALTLGGGGALTAPAAAAGARCPTPLPGVLASTPVTYPRTVSLTFDDGPAADTRQILGILRREHVKATFFVVGQEVRRLPSTLRRVAADGHAIGNHTYAHPQDLPGSSPRGRFDELPAPVQRNQLDRTTAAVRRTTGVTPCYFRGSAGHQSSMLTQSLLWDRGMNNVRWSTDSDDWRAPRTPSTSWVRTIVRNATVGGHSDDHPIVLMHDGGGRRPNTVAALPAIIDYYRSRGFVFTTLVGTSFSGPSPAPTVPVAGDVDGDGREDVGRFRGGRWVLRDGAAGMSTTFAFGRGTDTPIIGDWNGDGVDGVDGVGVRRGRAVLVARANRTGAGVWVQRIGRPIDVAVTGDWDGNGTAEPAVVRATTVFRACSVEHRAVSAVPL